MLATVDPKRGPIASFLNRWNPFSRLVTGEIKAFHGGGYPGQYGSHSAGGKWPVSLSSAGSGLFLNHRALRQQARVAMHESPQGRAIVERKVDAVANTGLNLESTPQASILGISLDQAAEWGRDVSGRFDLWAKDKKQHRPETMTFYQAQWLYSFFKGRDNDIFVRLYYSPEKVLQNPLQFSFLDPDQIRGYGFTSSHGFHHHHHDGIIRDDRGREIAYLIYIKKPDGSYDTVDLKARGPKSGRIFMLHGWQSEYAGQGRGYTKLAPIIQELENFTDFSLAHIKQAINQADFVGWVIPSKDEDTIPVFNETLTNFGAGPAAENFSSESSSEDLGTSPIGGFECYDIPEASFSVPGSTFLQSLTKGADIKFADPNSPTTTYDMFQNAFLTSLSAASGTPLEVVHMKFANNFSASRATLLLFQRIVEIEREDMVADFLNPVFEMWMAGEIAAGRISAPGWIDPRLRKAWLKATWRGTPVPDIDPGKLAKAREINLLLGATNIEREAQQHSNTGADDNIALNNRAYSAYEPLPFAGGGEDSDSDDEKEEN